MEQLQLICNELKQEKEIAIIEKYANKVKHIIIILLDKIIDFAY
jgi:nitrogenase subunit NifH